MDGNGAARERGPLLWAQGAGLLALCALGACGWILAEVLPAGLPRLTGHGVRLGVIGLGAWLLAGRSETGWRVWRLGLVGVCLVGAPAVLLQVAREGVGESSAVTLSAVVPVLIVVYAAYVGNGPEAMRMIPAALVGLGGVMLVFPLEAPASARGWVLFGLASAAEVLVAVGSVRAYRLLRGVRLTTALAAVGLGGAGVLLVAGLARERASWSCGVVRSEAVLLVGLELPAMVLLVWLLRTVEPGRAAVRFLLTPMIAVGVGALAVRAAVDWRMVVGVLLMGGASWRLWSYRERDEAVGIVPR